MAGLMGYGQGANLFASNFMDAYGAGQDRYERRKAIQDANTKEQEDLARQTQREQQITQGLMSMTPGYANADPMQQQRLAQNMTPEVAQLMYQANREDQRAKLEADRWNREQQLREGTAALQRQEFYSGQKEKELARTQDQRDALGTAQLLGVPEMAGHFGGNRAVTATMQRPMSSKGIREAVELQKGKMGAGGFGWDEQALLQYGPMYGTGKLSPQQEAMYEMAYAGKYGKPYFDQTLQTNVYPQAPAGLPVPKGFRNESGDRKPMSAEGAAKAQQLEIANSLLNEIEGMLFKDGKYNKNLAARANVPFIGAVPWDNEAKIFRTNYTFNVEAFLRALSGAGVPKEEVTRYSDMLESGYTDTPESARNKLNIVRQFTAGALEKMGRPLAQTGGKGGQQGNPSNLKQKYGLE